MTEGKKKKKEKGARKRTSYLLATEAEKEILSWMIITSAWISEPYRPM